MTTLLVRKPYVALTVTIVANQANNLLALINAALASSNLECPGAAREVNIQNAAGNTGSIFVGDSNVSNTIVGYELVPGAAGAVGASRLYRSDVNSVDIGRLYVYSTVATQKLNVEVCVY